MRCIVVGAGVVGLAVARELARAGACVVVLEATRPGAGTSSTSFAWVNANQKVPEPYYRLNVLGMEEHARLAADGGGWWHQHGHLRWAHAGDAQEALSRVVQQVSSFGYPVRVVERQEALRLEPDVLLPDDVDSAVFFPSEGHCDPATLMAHLIGDLLRHGGELRHPATVTSVSATPRGARVVLAGGDVLEADHVVTCAGRWTEQLLGEAGHRVPLQPHTGPGSAPMSHLVTTGPLPTGLRGLLTAADLNVRPHGGGRLMLQASDLDGTADALDPPAADGAVGQEMLRRLRERLRWTDAARLEWLGVGWRVLPADRLTVAGALDPERRLYVVATHSGITLAPLLGRIVRAEIVDGDDVPELALFRPDRFAADPADAAGQGPPKLVRAAGEQ